MSISRVDYCQFLLSSQGNYTMTNFAEHGSGFSHDSVNRLMRRDKLTGRMVWEHVEGDIVPSPNGCLVFDDSVLDKGHSRSIEMARRQYSGNAHGLIKGIGMINCLYVNPESGHYWIVDYRLFNPEGDGKTKIDHVREMLTSAVANKCLPFKRVLFDSWYATKELMLLVERFNKAYYCPIKERKYRRADSLEWTPEELAGGKQVKVRGFPKDHKMRLFRVAVSTNRTDLVVTNDMAQWFTQDVQEACALRWKVEQFHREIKQLTGIEKCQCRKARIQRNHIACAVLVWVKMTAIARKACTTVYQSRKAYCRTTSDRNSEVRPSEWLLRKSYKYINTKDMTKIVSSL